MLLGLTSPCSLQGETPLIIATQFNQPLSPGIVKWLRSIGIQE